MTSHQRFAAGRALVACQRPEGMLRQDQPCRQFGVRQALPVAEALLDQARLDRKRGVGIAGREDRLGGAPRARQGVTIQTAGRGSLAASARYIGACSSRLVSHSGTSMTPYSMARAFSSTIAWRISQNRVSVMRA